MEFMTRLRFCKGNCLEVGNGFEETRTGGRPRQDSAQGSAEADAVQGRGIRAKRSVNTRLRTRRSGVVL